MTEFGVTEDLLRRLAPQVLGTLVRRYGQFAVAEDATQEALLQATQEGAAPAYRRTRGPGWSPSRHVG